MARLTNVVSRSHGLTVELPRELARSRRHSHPFSLIMLCGDSGGHLSGVIDRVALRLRLSDLLIRLGDDRLLVACPETNAAGARKLQTDLVTLIASDGVAVRTSTATFPKSALTASELLQACEAGLDQDLQPTADTEVDPWSDASLRVFSDRGGHR